MGSSHAAHIIMVIIVRSVGTSLVSSRRLGGLAASLSDPAVWSLRWAAACAGAGPVFMAFGSVAFMDCGAPFGFAALLRAGCCPCFIALGTVARD